MQDNSKRTGAPSAARDGAEPPKGNQPVDRDRRAVRTVDLTDEDIAAIEASEMARASSISMRRWTTPDRDRSTVDGGRRRPEEGRGLAGGVPWSI